MKPSTLGLMLARRVCGCIKTFSLVSCRMISRTRLLLLAIKEDATARNPAASRNTVNAIKLVEVLFLLMYRFCFVFFSFVSFADSEHVVSSREVLDAQ